MSYLLYAGCVLLALGGLFPLCIGLLTIFYWIKSPKAPADESNRLNNIASWWIGLTRTEVMAKSYRFFQQDIMDNVHGIERYPYPPGPTQCRHKNTQLLNVAGKHFKTCSDCGAGLDPIAKEKAAR